MDNDKIIKRYDFLYSERQSSFDQDADLIERYCDPIRGGKMYLDQTNEAEIQFRRPEVYDSTALNSSNILSASVQSAVTPADTKWFDMLFRNDEISKDKEAVEWLQECGQRVFLALQDSSFELSNQEAVQDMVNYGNTVVFEEEDMQDGVYKGLAFDTVPIREIYFDEDYMQRIGTFYRRLQWTPLQIMSKFPEDQVPQVVKDKAESQAASSTRMDVIFCIFKRDDIGDVSPPVAAKLRPYGGKYVLKEGMETIGEETGYYEMPTFLARWAKTSGSKWGHGPAHLALPTVLTLNTMMEQELAYIEKVIDPPTLVTERNAFGSLDLTAGGVNVVQDIDGMVPYPVSGGYGEAKTTQQELREMVQSIFRVDQLQLKQSPAMTATEAQMRYEEILRLLGPTRGRLENEYLNQLIQRSFNILYRNGQFDEPPESVVAYTQQGGELDIQYLGPMARSQKMDQVASIERWVMTAANLGGVLPGILDGIEGDAVLVELAELGGVPAKLRKSQDEIDEKRKADADKMEQMQQAQLAQEQGAGATALAEGEQALQAVQ